MTYTYVKTALNDLRVGDIVNIADENSNDHDFRFTDAAVTKIVQSRSLFQIDCIDLFFGKRFLRFETDCNYLFDVRVN